MARKLQLYATGSATATSVAQVTVPSAATLKGVYYSIIVDGNSDGGSVRLELSKIPTNQIATNGAQDPFLEFGSFTNFVTSGLSENGKVGFLPLSEQCRQGEVLYLHATVAGTATYYANFIFVY